LTVLPCAAILFDSDGVLVDSDDSVLRAWEAWADGRGLDRAMVLALVHGRPSAATVAQLVDEAERADALADIDARELADAAAVGALPGAGDLVRSMPADRWAVVTSATRPLGVARFASAGLPLPVCMVTADDVTHGKPHPEGYLAAAAALGRPAGETLVMEDSPAGIRAARAARVGWVVGVGERALETAADVVVRDLRDVAWTDAGLHVARALRPA
jgi:mannitol-1-/sugar-/sorbitol-6-phosphatase